jgi:uncharacterized protein (DUF1778 family)
MAKPAFVRRKMDMQKVDDKPRTARLEARITDEQKSVLARAAALSGRSLSDFVVAAAQDAATKVIQEQTTIRLAETDRDLFVGALLNPPQPNARLRKAAKAYRQKMGL